MVKLAPLTDLATELTNEMKKTAELKVSAKFESLKKLAEEIGSMASELDELGRVEEANALDEALKVILDDINK